MARVERNNCGLGGSRTSGAGWKTDFGGRVRAKLSGIVLGTLRNEVREGAAAITFVALLLSATLFLRTGFTRLFLRSRGLDRIQAASLVGENWGGLCCGSSGRPSKDTVASASKLLPVQSKAIVKRLQGVGKFSISLECCTVIEWRTV